MVKNMRKSHTVIKEHRVITGSIGDMSPDDLKELVRRGMMGMAVEERAEFIGSLAAELRRENHSMSAYLIPLGIPGRSPEELTPTEVGHLVRFLKMNVLQAIKAVERALARYAAFEEYVPGGGRLAA